MSWILYMDALKFGILNLNVVVPYWLMISVQEDQSQHTHPLQHPSITSQMLLDDRRINARGTAEIITKESGIMQA